MLQILESIGAPLEALHVPESAQFDCATALLNYMLGAAGQNAANARQSHTNRGDYLASVAERWTANDPELFPFVHRISANLRDHDDREQYLAGIDLILAGITALL